jgi:streptomycin 6-kinase
LNNVRQRWPNRAEPWAKQVENELRALCDRYEVVASTVLPARYGLVVAVDTPVGALVLRASPDPHGPEQTAVAIALAELGISPKVHQAVSTDHGTWTVLDRVRPGTPLYFADLAVISLESLFAPLAAMRGRPAPRPGMSSITDWLRGRLEDDQLSDLRAGTTVAPEDERAAAVEALAKLTRDLTPGLCHGDASRGNIIASGPDHWKFIDPRGMSGESAYDVAVLANRVVRFRHSANLIQRIAKLSDASPERVSAWMAIAEAARV